MNPTELSFEEQLNAYMQQIGCSNKQLAAASGLGEASISRYRKGIRIPSAGSTQLNQLANGLAELSAKSLYPKEESEAAIRDRKTTVDTDSQFRTDHLQDSAAAPNSDSTTAPASESATSSSREPGNLPLSKDVILQTLTQTIAKGLTIPYDSYIANLNQIFRTLSLNQSEIAKAINYDTSYISRVLSGQRRVSNISDFTNDIISFLIRHPEVDTFRPLLAPLFQCNASDIRTPLALSEQLNRYICTHEAAVGDLSLQSFLVKMNDFNLEEFIDAIHFQDIKIPTMPLQMPVNKYYYGIEDMRKAELDFFKTTVTGKSTEPIFMYSNMPMEELAEDMEFNKKWMFGIAASLRKGIRIQIIHNLDRPFSELMLGFEAWIPIYMTGQVSPYYLPDYKPELFHELNYCSGSAILHGECLHGHYTEGRYYLSNGKSDIAYYRTRTNHLLQAARPLMDIYDYSRNTEFEHFFQTHLQIKADRHVMDASLPLYTMPLSLLQDMIKPLADDKKEQILNAYHSLQDTTDTLLQTNEIIWEHDLPSQDTFQTTAPSLMFPELFLAEQIPYTYEQFQAHYRATLSYEKAHARFHLKSSRPIPFKNIRITTVAGQYFIVTKCKSPNIHFVIHHPTLLQAMENFYVAKWDTTL